MPSTTSLCERHSSGWPYLSLWPTGLPDRDFLETGNVAAGRVLQDSWRAERRPSTRSRRLPRWHLDRSMAMPRRCGSRGPPCRHALFRDGDRHRAAGQSRRHPPTGRDHCAGYAEQNAGRPSRRTAPHACRSRFIHPFDDDQFIAGNGTLGLEILEDLPEVDVVVASVGGGGS